MYAVAATYRETSNGPVAEGNCNKVEEHAAKGRDGEQQAKGSAALACIIHLSQNGLNTGHDQRQSHSIQCCPGSCLHAHELAMSVSMAKKKHGHLQV